MMRLSVPATRHNLDNGLTILLKEMHHAPVVCVLMAYRVGSRNERPGQTGVSHWVEHMMFKGTPQFPEGALDRLVSREGGYWNAYTWLDYTAYYETLPAAQIDLGLRLEADRLVNASMTAAACETERQVILSERDMYANDPDFSLHEALVSVAFRVHPYGHDVIGLEADLRRMTRADLYAYYRQHYVPDQAVLVVTGDFESAAVLRRIDQLFGPLRPGNEPITESVVEPTQEQERRVVVRGPGETAYLAVAHHVPAATHRDYHALAILNAALAGGSSLGAIAGGGTNRSSRLYRALVDTELAAGISGTLGPTIDPYLYTLYAVANTGHALPDLEAALLANVAELTTSPITEQELFRAMKRAKAQFVMAGESVTGQAQLLAIAEITAGDFGWYESILAALEAVTVEDLDRVYRAYLAEANRTLGWYEPNGKN